jgi:hypothetical protein
LKILPISIVQHFQSLNWILQATPKDTWSKALSKFPGTPENAARSPQTLTNEIAKRQRFVPFLSRYFFHVL